MEYDVLVKTKITDQMFTDGMRAARSIWFYNISKGNGPDPSVSWKSQDWWWGIDGDKLPYELKKVAAGIMTSMFWFSAEALDKLILPEWSSIWERDIICEISISTILNYYNVPLYDWDDTLCFMRCHCIPIDEVLEVDVIKRIKSDLPGIYHPIKGPIDEVFS